MHKVVPKDDREQKLLRGAAYNPEPSISATSSNVEIGYEGDQIGYPEG